MKDTVRAISVILLAQYQNVPFFISRRLKYLLGTHAAPITWEPALSGAGLVSIFLWLNSTEI